MVSTFAMLDWTTITHVQTEELFFPKDHMTMRWVLFQLAPLGAQHLDKTFRFLFLIRIPIVAYGKLAKMGDFRGHWKHAASWVSWENHATA